MSLEFVGYTEYVNSKAIIMTHRNLTPTGRQPSQPEFQPLRSFQQIPRNLAVARKLIANSDFSALENRVLRHFDHSPSAGPDLYAMSPLKATR